MHTSFWASSSKARKIMEFFSAVRLGRRRFNFAYALNYPKGVSYSSPGQRPGLPMQIGSTWGDEKADKRPWK
jgi:hypothetical protein